MRKVKRPPGPSERVPGVLLLEFGRNPIQWLADAASRYGGMVYFKLGPEHIYLVSNPEYIKEVLVLKNNSFVKSKGLKVVEKLLGQGLLTSEGDFHARERRLIQPVFQHQKIARYAAVMTAYAKRTRERWQDGEELDVHAEMMGLTLAVVAKCLFNADLESEAAQIGRALAESLEYFNRLTGPFSPVLDKLPLPSNVRFHRAKKTLDSVIYGMIRQRRADSATGEGDGDLLSLLLHAQDVEGGSGGMTDEQLHDEAMTLLLAGHETTANALTWTWYLLSQHPEVEGKLHQEVDGLLGREPTFEDFSRLSYTRKVLTESMRLFPPAWAVEREATADLELGGYSIPMGSTVVMSQYVVQRDPKYFPEPEEFRPERWTPEFKERLPTYAYFPFGGGPRVCVGEPFAWMEGVLLLASIAQHWEMRIAKGQEVALLPRITLRPKHGMRMNFHRRSTHDSSTVAPESGQVLD